MKITMSGLDRFSLSVSRSFFYPILFKMHIIKPVQYGLSKLLIFNLLINPLSNRVVENKKVKAVMESNH